MHNPVSLLSTFRYTLEFHLSGLTGTTNHPDRQKIRIIGFFFQNRLNCHFELGEKILRADDLGYIFIYVQIKH